MIGYGHEVWSYGGYYFWVSSRERIFEKPQRLTFSKGSYGCTVLRLPFRRLVV